MFSSAISSRWPPIFGPELTEIVINRPGEIFVEGPGGWARHEAATLTQEHLLHLATAAAGFTKQDVSAERPIVSTTLLGDERCQIVLPPAVAGGTVSLTIRKPAALTMSLRKLEKERLFDDVRAASEELSADEHRLLALKEAGHWREFLELAVRAAATSSFPGPRDRARRRSPRRWSRRSRG